MELDKNKKNNSGCIGLFLLIPSIIILVIALVFFIISIIIRPFIPEEIEGVQVQLQGATSIVLDTEPVIFDTLIADQSPAIEYDNATGEIIITRSGTYYISWWVAADGAGPATTIDLTLRTSTGIEISASSPIVSGVVTGNALIDVNASIGTPVIVQLVNTTGEDLFIAPTTVKADLTILRVD